MVKKEIKIREAIIKDVESILNIQLIVWPTIYSSGKENISKEEVIESMQPDSNEISKIWKRVITTHKDKEGDAYTLVAEYKGEVVGFCYVVKKNNGLGEIRSLYVIPEYQGLGIGKKFMNKVMVWFGNDTEIILETNKADCFFKKFGFKKTGNTYTQKLNNGKECIEYEMKRSYENTQ